MHAAGTVARFTTHLLRIGSFGQQPRVIRGVKILGDILMALLTRLTANKGRSLDMRRNNDRPLHGRAGNHHDSRGDSEHADHDSQMPKFCRRWWVDVVHKILRFRMRRPDPDAARRITEWGELNEMSPRAFCFIANAVWILTASCLSSVVVTPFIPARNDHGKGQNASLPLLAMTCRL